MLCEMCGRNDNLVEADIEGVELSVCSVCLQYGSVKKPKIISDNWDSANRSFSPRNEIEKKVVDNFASIIRKERETRGMSQEDFAKFLQERQSIIAKWEAGSIVPEISTAQRLGRILNKTLIVEDVTSKVNLETESSKKKNDIFTLGDFVKVRKRV
ncbi:MAG: multiprotein bridging factor aMBF1 [archaeon]|nr:multiprotein bridging factor aMBF1 [archaeon]